MYAGVHNDDDAELPQHTFGSPAPPFDIVGVAASAGGIKALREFLRVLPGDFPCPIVVIQHLPPAAIYKSALDAVLGRQTCLNVKWAVHGEPLRGGSVLLGPQDHHVRVARDSTVEVFAGRKFSQGRPSADLLFTSIAKVFGERSAVVVLSGSLSDGAEGAYEVAAVGGRVLVQDQRSALISDMPLAALRTGAVDYSFSPEMIARALIALVMVPGAAAWFRVWRPNGLRRPDPLYRS